MFNIFPHDGEKLGHSSLRVPPYPYITLLAFPRKDEGNRGFFCITVFMLRKHCTCYVIFTFMRVILGRAITGPLKMWFLSLKKKSDDL